MYETRPGVQTYPFATAGQNSGQWLGFNPTATFTFTIPSGFALGSIYFPTLGSGGVQLFAGLTATGTPFYTTASSGAELVPMPSGLTSVTLQSVSGAGSVMQIFISSLNFEPFRMSPVSSQVTGVTATAPLTSSGGATPNIALSTPLAVIYGGTGVTNPSLINGTGITISGTWPNQTVAVTGAGVVTNVTASSPIVSSGGTAPNISFTGVVLDAGGVPHPTGVVVGGVATSGSSGLLTVNGPSGLTLQSATATIIDATIADAYFVVITSLTGGQVIFQVHDGSSTGISGIPVAWTLVAF